MDSITRDDLMWLRDLIKRNKDDADSPIVRMAEIVEKLATKSY
jgi:hypothetical protein